MVFLGLGLILLGALAILAAIFVSEDGTGGELLGFDVSVLGAVLVGVAAGMAILWGFGILKWGTRRGLEHRKERKKIGELSDKLERVEADKRRNDDEEN